MGHSNANGGADAALSVFMDVRRIDQEASLASVAGEVEMEEEGHGARLFQSKVSVPSLRGLHRLGRYAVSVNLRIEREVPRWTASV